MSTKKTQEPKGSKKELEATTKKLEALEKQLEKAKKDLKVAEEVREQVVLKEHKLKKELKERDTYKEDLEEKNKFLTEQLNGLSNLFDKQYQQFSDLLVLQQVFLRNTQSNKELLDILIKKFNGTDKEK
jgi:hypothetical protein